MEVSAFHVATVQPIAKWESMYAPMHSVVKTSSDLHVWVVVFALLFVREASLTSKIGMKMVDLTNQFYWETIVLL